MRDDPDSTLPPEARNRSQDDAGEQAQTLADEALAGDPIEAADSERAPGPGTDLGDDGGSLPDLVDIQRQMVSDGRIDMSAYRGERNDDDVEEGLGPQGLEDDFPRGDP